MTLKRFLAVFAMWEAYWAYEYFSAPIPDELMGSVAAIIFGVFLPLAIIIPVAIFLAMRRWS